MILLYTKLKLESWPRSPQLVQHIWMENKVVCTNDRAAEGTLLTDGKSEGIMLGTGEGVMLGTSEDKPEGALLGNDDTVGKGGVGAALGGSDGFEVGEDDGDKLGD